MDRPTISFILPTLNPDRPLQRAINSVTHQLLPGDEIIVVGDSTDEHLSHAEQCCAEFVAEGYNVRYLEHTAGYHNWGHAQINYAFENSECDLLCQSDDDDIWTPTAAFDIRYAAMANPDQPLLFRFMSYNDGKIWKQKGLVQRDFIGGHCLVQPNIPMKIGKMTDEYSGDFSMIHDCLMKHGGYDSAVWIDKLIAIARPA